MLFEEKIMGGMNSKCRMHIGCIRHIETGWGRRHYSNLIMSHRHRYDAYYAIEKWGDMEEFAK